jgi:hypothetical protein
MKIRESFDVLCLVALTLFAIGLPLVVVSADVPAAGPIQVTPPAPVFDDAKRLAELAA